MPGRRCRSQTPDSRPRASGSDDAPVINPPETLIVNPQRAVLFDHEGRPLTRKAGF
jgi:hypothetical protein